jgi:nodulation protein E
VVSAAQIQSFDSEAHFPRDRIPQLDRYTQLALVAAREAVADAGLNAAALQSAAVVAATGCGGKETDEQAYQQLYLDGRKRLHPLTIPRGMPSAVASQLSMDLGVEGPVFAVSSACASSNHAVAQALMLVQSGLVDVALVVGSDAPFSYGLLKAWEALRVLSPDTCRPFSEDRKGVVLGEGAGALVFESEQHARRRGARIYAELLGCGMSADAGHITEPSVEGASRAIRSALQSAAIPADAIDYINAHGTGTELNDVTETRAIRAALGSHADRVAVSSTKSMHGHALGAAGALELVATVLSIEAQTVPATQNFTVAGEGCDLDYVPNDAREMKLGCTLSNSFAFGGLNAVVVVGAYQGLSRTTLV